MNDIQKDLELFLNGTDSVLSSVGGRFTAKDFNNLREVLGGTKRNFLIFDNAGGKKFEIKFQEKDTDKKGFEDFIKYCTKKHNWVYSYQLDGKQVIIRNLWR